jgi:hypothetical protein
VKAKVKSWFWNSIQFLEKRTLKQVIGISVATVSVIPVSTWLIIKAIRHQQAKKSASCQAQRKS